MTVPTETVSLAKSWPRKNQSERSDLLLKTALPYNNLGYFPVLAAEYTDTWHVQTNHEQAKIFYRL